MTAALSIRDGRRTDADGLAAVHAAAFPDYFQTHMGPGFLRRFYSAFLRPGHLVVVAELHGELVGLVAGTADLARFRKDLYPPNLLPFAATFAWKFATDHVVRGSAGIRLAHLPIAMRSLFSRRSPDRAGTPYDNWMTMYLFSICVEPSQQGNGIASALLAEFNRRSTEVGAERIELTVVRDNEPAIRLYEREGWTRSDDHDGAYRYALEL